MVVSPPPYGYSEVLQAARDHHLRSTSRASWGSSTRSSCKAFSRSAIGSFLHEFGALGRVVGDSRERNCVSGRNESDADPVVFKREGYNRAFYASCDPFGPKLVLRPRVYTYRVQLCGGSTIRAPNSEHGGCFRPWVGRRRADREVVHRLDEAKMYQLATAGSSSYDLQMT